MPRSSPSPEPRAPGARSSWASAAAILLARGVGLALVAIAVWGFWVSRDAGRVAGTAGIGAAKNNLATAVFLLVWIFFFGPFLYFGVAVLWSTFAEERRGWLVPLRLFTYVVSLRAAAEFGGRPRRSDSGQKALPASSTPTHLPLLRLARAIVWRVFCLRGASRKD